jgi:hypothetical protein
MGSDEGLTLPNVSPGACPRAHSASIPAPNQPFGIQIRFDLGEWVEEAEAPETHTFL